MILCAPFCAKCSFIRLEDAQLSSRPRRPRRTRNKRFRPSRIGICIGMSIGKRQFVQLNESLREGGRNQEIPCRDFAASSSQSGPFGGRILLELCVLGIGLLKDGNVWIGVFPECEETLICRAAPWLCRPASHRRAPVGGGRGRRWVHLEQCRDGRGSSETLPQLLCPGVRLGKLPRAHIRGTESCERSARLRLGLLHAGTAAACGTKWSFRCRNFA